MYKLIGQSKNIYFRCCLICYFQFRGGSTRLSKLQTDGDQVIIITKLSDFFKVSVLVKSLFPEVTFECCQLATISGIIFPFFPRCLLFSQKEYSNQKTYVAKVNGSIHRTFWGSPDHVCFYRWCGVAGRAALQSVCECPQHQQAGISVLNLTNLPLY